MKQLTRILTLLALFLAFGSANAAHAQDTHLAAVGLEDTLEHLDARGLARAVRSQQTETRAALGGEIDAVDRGESAVPFDEPARVDGRCTL